MRTGAKLALGLVVVALAAGGWYWQRAGSSSEAPYRTAKVERGPLAATVTAAGTLNAMAVTQVGTAISGEIKEILVDFKAAVKKDQVLARLDPATFEQRVAQARADLAAAKGAALAQRRSLLRQAELDLERTVIRAPVPGTVILRNVDAGQTVSAGPKAPALFAIAEDLREM